MKVRELIEKLLTLNPEADVMIFATYEGEYLELEEVHDAWMPEGEAQDLVIIN